MNLVEIILITLFCIFQSVFGVGLLLLGTPTFLLIGYNFFEVLNILLPYSIVISFLQIFINKRKKFKFGKKILIHSIPFLILGLIIVEHIQHKINFVLIVSIFLIFFSVLNIRNLKTNTGLKDISINVSSGEIVGLLGLVGSGRTEILRAVFGADKIVEGKIEFLEKKIEIKNPKDAIKKGIMMIPEDRRKLGLVFTQDAKSNITS